MKSNKLSMREGVVNERAISARRPTRCAPWGVAAACLLLSGAGWAQSVTRTVNFEYDANGQLIKEVVEPLGDVNTTKLTTQYVRNSVFGVVTKRQLLWHDPQSNLDVVRDVETTVYDVKTRYPKTVTNAKSQSETRNYDEGTGNLLSITGPNQLTTTWSYDGWGRRLKEGRADGTSTTTAYRQCIDTCLDSAVTVIVTQNWLGTSQTTVPTEVFADSLGRNVLTRTWGFDGTAVLTESVYNSLGLLDHGARARFANAAAVWTNYFYDSLGRLREVHTPNAAGTGDDVSTTTYDGQTTTYVNAKGQSRIEVRNGLGKLKSVTDDSHYSTSYVYDGFGNLLRTTDPKGNQVNVTYDTLGRKTQLADPDLGAWIYLVNPLGQTYQQTDAKAQVTTYTFDELGRMTRRLEPDLDSNWVYDSAIKGVGKLAEAYTRAGNTKDYRRLYGYDNLSRSASVTISLDWDYVQEYGYDSFGRQSTTTHRRNAKGGSGGPFNTLTNIYNAQGYRSQIQLSGDGTTRTVWSALSINADGQLTKEQLGNGVRTDRGYNPYTARLTSIASGPDNGSGGPTPSLQNDSYDYDTLGNLASRSQLMSSSGPLVTETFGYDNLNRLASSQVAGQVLKSFGYDAIGNLTSKTGAGTYAYPSSGAASVLPHAVSAITGSVAGLTNPSFTYDANGNLSDALGRHFAWTSYNQAKDIDKLSAGSAVQRTSFIFDTEHQRTRQSVSPVNAGVVGSPTSTIYYGGAIEKEVDTVANTTTIRTYLPVRLGYVEEKFSGTAIAATASTVRATRYFLADHLGSPIAVVDDNQTVLQRMSYDPWGRRRNPDGSDDASATLGGIANAQDRSGYTGEEQLDQLGLVHLNGRIYDPISARFVSADPHVPDMGDGQNFNRYTYVLNNPLAYTDPTGFVQELQDHYREAGLAQGWGAGAAGSKDWSGVIVTCSPACWWDEDPLLVRAMAAAVANQRYIVGRWVREKQRSLLGAGGRALRLAQKTAVILRPMAVRSGLRAGATVLAGGGPENLFADLGGLIVLGGSLVYECAQVCDTLGSVQSESDEEAPGGKSGANGEQNQDGGNRFPDRPLPRDKNGNPAPDPEAEGAHTQLGQTQGRKGKYDQGREFDADGKPVRDIDFTDHGRPGQHTNPHQHDYVPNETGGTPRRGPPMPLGG